MTPAEAAAQLHRMASELPDVCAEAVDDGLDIIREEAMRLSSGMETRADHHRKDHPYARRHKRIKPPNDAILINFQTAEFLHDWEKTPVIESADAVAGAVVNFNEKADWLEFGTRLMFPRDVPGHAELRTEPEVTELIERRLTDFFDV